MKANLRVRYTVYSGETQSPDDIQEKEIYKELWKDFDIEFAPMVGLRLYFPSIKTNHERAGEYDEILNEAPELATGLFTIEDVIYDTETKLFALQAYESVETEDILLSIAAQLTVGKGFTVDDFPPFDL